MADLVCKQHDTWPPIRGGASDEAGLLPLGDADSIRLILKAGNRIISNPVQVIDPPEEDANEPGRFYNWQCLWGADDTSDSGSYQVEMEITWDANASPPAVETVPSSGQKQIIIEPDLG